MKHLIAFCLAASSLPVHASATCTAKFGPDADRIGQVLKDGFYRGFVTLPSDQTAAAGEIEMRVDGRRAFVTLATPHGPLSTMVDLEHTVVIRELDKYLMYAATLDGAATGALLLFPESAVADGAMTDAFSQFAAVPARILTL